MTAPPSPRPLRQLPDQAYLKECFLYDESSGNLIWKARPLSHFGDKRTMKIWNTKYAGKRAGAVDPKQRRIVGIAGKTYVASRIVWVLCSGPIPPGMKICHSSGDPLDDRIDRIRLATTLQTVQNQYRRRRSKSGYRGVFWDAEIGKWLAVVVLNKKRTYIGSYSDKQDAARAAEEFRVKHFGEFAGALIASRGDKK